MGVAGGVAMLFVLGDAVGGVGHSIVTGLGVLGTMILVVVVQYPR